MSNQPHEIWKKNFVNFIQPKNHLEKHVEKEITLPSKELSQSAVNFVKSSDKNNAETINDRNDRIAVSDDWTISRIREDVPKIEKREVKLKFFRGATIEDVDDNINLILNKEPDFTIIYM